MKHARRPRRPGRVPAALGRVVGHRRHAQRPGGRPGPDLVARAIADAIEQPDTPLRVPVGADAELIFATRDAMGDAEFEATMRATIGLTW